MAVKFEGEKVKLSIISLVAIFFSTYVAAWDGVISGKIQGIDVAASGDNYGFRVSVDSGSTKMCGNNHTWAYLNDIG